MPNTAITANRLMDGSVIYLTATGGWSESLTDAAVAETREQEAELLAIAEREARAGWVIGPYAFKVEAGASAPLPLGRREILRTLGPSVRTDLGYQAARN